MNVLSLFDGISCGRIALERCGIPVENYYSSEIDKYSIQISKTNYPDIIQLGDVSDWKQWGIDFSAIDLILAGSPCQGFSTAGRQLAFDDPRSKLFFVFSDILSHVKSLNPDVLFLLENVSMKKEHLAIITNTVGVVPAKIDSGLVSAQKRTRYYWYNWVAPSPQDRRIMLSDITSDRDSSQGQSFTDYDPVKKANYYQWDVSGKGHNSQQDRAYHRSGKFGCFPSARAITKRKMAIGGDLYRDLDLHECEALQTLPANYTRVPDGFSLNKSLSAIGNGWTVDVVSHLLSFSTARTNRLAVTIKQPREALL